VGGEEGMTGAGEVGGGGRSGMSFPRSDLRRGMVAVVAGVGGCAGRDTG
jgi:hypothetical protein